MDYGNPEIKEHSNSRSNHKKNEKKSKESTNVNKLVTGLSKMTIGKFKAYAIIVASVPVIVAAVWFIGIPAFSSMFYRLSPWSQQTSEIAAKNNIRDAYSAIIGTDVGLVSQKGIVKWFSSKEAKEVDIFIPKLINYSGLFDDDSRREELKNTFEESINSDVMKESAVYYRIFYDGSTLGQWKNGEKVSSYKDLKTADKTAIMKDLRLKLRTEEAIEFKNWEKKNELESVSFEFEPSSNSVNVQGIFESDGTLWLSPDYKLSAKYQYDDGSWKLANSSLKVDKVK
ncbi:MAG TPA: hypothetical protein IAA20_01685 [Candidatus Enterococcus avicola]|uniref:Uncharacterized protein n=1 Tax=Candidatus Enterococcus avicola TaxID=2838561 RepID=A0A9D2F5V6_9ENTE|nr:hypothetical protein [Candidatus Enterococcus avicola]